MNQIAENEPRLPRMQHPVERFVEPRVQQISEIEPMHRMWQEVEPRIQQIAEIEPKMPKRRKKKRNQIRTAEELQREKK